MGSRRGSSRTRSVTESFCSSESSRAANAATVGCSNTVLSGTTSPRETTQERGNLRGRQRVAPEREEVCVAVVLIPTEDGTKSSGYKTFGGGGRPLCTGSIQWRRRETGEVDLTVPHRKLALDVDDDMRNHVRRKDFCDGSAKLTSVNSFGT